MAPEIWPSWSCVCPLTSTSLSHGAFPLACQHTAHFCNGECGPQAAPLQSKALALLSQGTLVKKKYSLICVPSRW